MNIEFKEASFAYFFKIKKKITFLNIVYLKKECLDAGIIEKKEDEFFFVENYFLNLPSLKEHNLNTFKEKLKKFDNGILPYKDYSEEEKEQIFNLISEYIQNEKNEGVSRTSTPIPPFSLSIPTRAPLEPKTFEEILNEAIIYKKLKKSDLKILYIKASDFRSKKVYFNFVDVENGVLQINLNLLKQSEEYNFDGFENLKVLKISQPFRIKKLDLQKLGKLKTLILNETDLEELETGELLIDELCYLFNNDKLLNMNFYDKTIVSQNFHFVSLKVNNPLLLLLIKTIKNFNEYDENQEQKNKELEKELEEIADKYNSLASKLEQQQSNKRDVGVQTDCHMEEEIDYLRKGTINQLERIKELEKEIEKIEEEQKMFRLRFDEAIERNNRYLNKNNKLQRIIDAKEKEKGIYEKELKKLNDEVSDLTQEIDEEKHLIKTFSFCLFIFIFSLYILYKLIKWIFN